MVGFPPLVDLMRNDPYSTGGAPKRHGAQGNLPPYSPSWWAWLH